MNEYDLILALFNKFESYSFCKNDLPKRISFGDIDKLKGKNILKEELVPPSHCLLEDCSQPAETLLNGDKIIVKCSKNPTHIKEVSKSDFIAYRIELSSGLLIILEQVLGKIFSISVYDNGDYCKIRLEKDRKPILFIFSMETSISEDKLFQILSPHISTKEFIVLIHKSSEDNYNNIDSILKKLPLGSVIFNLPLEKIENMNVKKELEEWINYTGQLSDLESEILDKIDDEKLKQLTVSIDTNPKYILSALSRLKVCKASGSYSSKSWEDMEHIVTLIFHCLYTSEIKYGGGKQKGKAVSDNVFFIRENGGTIAGIVDSKCSMDVDLSKEKTEKYEKYFQKVRALPWSINKKALIFVVLDTKSDYTIKEFFGRLKNKLKEGEYVIILPINSLEMIIHSYLGVILRGRINLNKSDFRNLLMIIFDKDFLEKKGKIKIETNLYRLTPDILLEEFKKRAESPSSIETAFKEIFED